MDINPARDTYVLGQLFFAPTATRRIPAIAVKKTSADLIVSAYTIIVLFIFIVGWQLLMSLVLAFYPAEGHPNRYIALVALWNTDDACTGCLRMGKYCWAMLGWNKANPNIENVKSGTSTATATTVKAERDAPRGGMKSCRGSFWWGALLFFLALSMAIGDMVAGTLISRHLIVGSVAPVSPHSIFYPDVYGVFGAKDVNPLMAKFQVLSAPATFRAIGAVGASGDIIKRRVIISPDMYPLTYRYNVTALDMGLQIDLNLEQIVEGSCHLEYNWFNKRLSTSEHDVYTFWYKRPYEVPLEAEKDTPPRVQGFPHPEILNQSVNRNATFAFVIHAAGRWSYTPQNDPWYQTMLMSQNASDSQNTSAFPSNRARYRIARGRPVLVCWEAATWKYNDKRASSQTLDSLPIKLDELWRNHVIPTEFSVPRILMLVKIAGWSALMSAGGFWSDTKVMHADSSRLYEDMGRLIRASWISSRNVLRDTTTTCFNNHSFHNIAEGPDGKVPTGAAQFVLQSPDVGTLSVRVLISVPSILLFLLLLQAILSYYLSHANIHREHPLHNLVSRATELQAAQLYRTLNEEVSGEGRWKGGQQSIQHVGRSEAPVRGTVGEDRRARTRRTPWAAVSEETLSDELEGQGGVRSQSGVNFSSVQNRVGYKQLPTAED